MGGKLGRIITEIAEKGYTDQARSKKKNKKGSSSGETARQFRERKYKETNESNRKRR